MADNIPESVNEMRQARERLREYLPELEEQLRACGKEEERRRHLLSEMRNERGWGGFLVYAALCYKRPEMLLERDEKIDVEAARKREDMSYTGLYVKPWSLAKEERFLERDDAGNCVIVAQRQHALFGGDWCKAWRDPASQGDESPTQDLGPKDESGCVVPPPPAGCTWEELAESQRVTKKAYDRAKARERKMKERAEKLEMVRGALKKLGRVLRLSRARARRPKLRPTEDVVVDGNKTPEKRVDSGRGSPVRDRHQPVG